MYKKRPYRSVSTVALIVKMNAQDAKIRSKYVAAGFRKESAIAERLGSSA
jgi:hypothetical protein